MFFEGSRCTWQELGEYRGGSGVSRTLETMLKYRKLVEGLNWTVVGECTRVVELFDAKLIRVRSDITAAQSESEGAASEEICDVHDSF